MHADRDAMTGMAIPPVLAGAGLTVGAGPAVGTGQKMSASIANFLRIADVAKRLATHLQPGSANNPTEFFRLCLFLARGIDYAVANNEVPSKALDLPLLLKQNACKIGWFSDKDSQELFTLANEIGNSFCSRDVNTVLSDYLSIISTVMSRFYPLMKMGQILASLEVKPGYGAYVIDFHISKNIAHSQQEKIWLFVVQGDNTETSACIISPQHVNFLLNGKGVEGRTTVSMDTGPQIPTNVTTMLKYGTNLLQAVGQFNGHYIIAVVFMSVTPLSETPVLLDYVESDVAAADPDSDIIEGPSCVSLNCPISYTRIRTPVKGHSCKHLQCFDFSNFVHINSRRPSWRCPHCNQHVCYSDIRVVQNMVKVLKEVGENVADVIISADGSWKAIVEGDDNADQTSKGTFNCQKETIGQQERTTFSNALPLVMDLTEDDNRMDVVSTSDIEDRKPSQATLQSQPVATNLTIPNAVVQNVASQVEDGFWSDVYLNHGSGTPIAGLGLQMVNGMSELNPASIMASSGITDAFSPVLNHDVVGHGNNNLTSLLQNQISASANLRQSQLVNAAVNNESGRLMQIPRHVNRAPIAVQALPVPSQTSIQQQRLSTNLNSAIPNGSSFASQAALSKTPTSNGFNMASNHMYRQLQNQRSHTNPHQVLDRTSPSLQHHSTVQNRNHPDGSSVVGQSVQQDGGVSNSCQLLGASRASSGLWNESQSLRQHQAFRMPQPRSRSPSVGRSTSALPLSQTQQRIAQVGAGNTAGFPNSQHSRFTAAAQLAVQMARQPPSVPVQIPTSRGTSYLNTDGTRAPAMMQGGNVGAAALANTGTDGGLNLSSEQNWRPSGRMRGSLSGQAATAYGDLIIQPTQPAPAPQPRVTSALPSVPPPMQAFLANSRNVTQAQSSTEPASVNGNLRTLT
ncbi:E4 SUMO-protein ligase PIAL1 isoform X2 [Hevea brasiliensis]|uniref:E4 SUMO-protein ligase PIAL1 isoform X2 n=1 Tax=Hevea brasiliensis TaxID=3981 RepID=UPI0025F84197|nr:E4 SUMO-protein ligase PIAL1 isoform X2 [Hevea brasiliensis]